MDYTTYKNPENKLTTRQYIKTRRDTRHTHPPFDSAKDKQREKNRGKTRRYRTAQHKEDHKILDNQRRDERDERNEKNT